MKASRQKPDAEEEKNRGQKAAEKRRGRYDSAGLEKHAQELRELASELIAQSKRIHIELTAEDVEVNGFTMCTRGIDLIGDFIANLKDAIEKQKRREKKAATE